MDVVALPVGGLLARPVDALCRDLRAAEHDHGCDLVMAAIGGYGTSTLVEALASADPPGIPVVGYSDVSIAVNVLARLGAPALHGPMLLPTFGGHRDECEPSLRSLRTAGAHPERPVILWADQPWTDEMVPWGEGEESVRAARSHPDEVRLIRPGEATGTLWGGSLRALSYLIGTRLWPKPERDHILMIEDEALSPFELRSLLAHWRMIGAFARCTAVLVAKHSRPIIGEVSVLDRIVEEEVPAPVIVAGLHLGHTHPIQTVPLGRQATVVADEARPVKVTIEPGNGASRQVSGSAR